MTRHSKVVEDFVHYPPSAEIAAQLQSESATTCKHRRNPCILRCGVQARIEKVDELEGIDEETGTHWYKPIYRLAGNWEVIPYEERLEWLKGFTKNQGESDAIDKTLAKLRKRTT